MVADVTHWYRLDVKGRVLIHVLGIAAATTGIILVTLYPFLPGPYDSLAGPLSFMAQVFGIVGLLLVPVGALWIVSGYWSPLAGKQYGIAIAALIVLSLVLVIVSLGALMSGPLLVIAVVALSIYAVTRLLPGLRRLKGSTPSINPAAFYLVVVPVAVALLQMATVGPAIEFSRNRAIRNSAGLIAGIEQHRVAQGRYPASLHSVHGDFKPDVIGIREYHYEPSGQAYNVFFEQLARSFGTREFVMYNPRDEQALTSHRIDILELTPEQLAVDQSRGHYAVHDAPHPHWKYFWFD